MRTVKITRKNAEKTIHKAAAVLQKGGVIIFPTETVYGIGADAFNKKAVNKLFVLKKRPENMPFQVLISDIKQVKSLARAVPVKAQALMKKSWPGPLTIVLKKKSGVSDTVTAGLKTVGIRMPDNKFILEVIEKLGRPIAASSANISGKKSPKTAGEAARHFRRGISLVIDGGRCRIGKASKVVDATGPALKTLRK